MTKESDPTFPAVTPGRYGGDIRDQIVGVQLELARIKEQIRQQGSIGDVVRALGEQSNERRRDDWSRFEAILERSDERAREERKDHKETIDKIVARVTALETAGANLTGKLAAAFTIASAVGGGVVALVLKLVHA